MMENWAIVIGIDHYPASESWTLQGAVRDAMAMRVWLLRPDGGNVPPENLLLLLSPRPDVRLPIKDVTTATHDNIVKAVNAIISRSNKRGNRSYFYFSGHGLSVDNDLSAKQGILASDFDRDASHHSLTVTSLFEVFQGTHFKEQYFIIDACRNIPLDRIRLSDFPNVPEPVIPASPQFVVYATQPRVEAMEIGFPGNESGAFTGALLKGLNGEGAAKAWDDNTGQYVVRWQELFSAVLEDVKSRKLRVGKGPLIQEPRQYGERGDENPEMGRLPDDSVPDVELSINLAPSPTLLPLANISVYELGGLVKQVHPPINKLPIVAQLRPRTYGVNGVAAGYQAVKKAVRLYQSAAVTLKFHKGPPGLPQTGPRVSQRAALRAPRMEVDFQAELSSLPSTRRRAPQRSDWPTAKGPLNKQLRGGLDVSAPDTLALLQIANEAGRILKTARGKIEQKDLPLGFYSVRIISPEGAVIAEEIESPKSGGTRTVKISVPSAKSPAMDYLTDCAGFQRGLDGSISPSETVGPMFFLKTSTVLALAAAAQLEGNKTYGQRLRKVPLPGFHQLTEPGTPSGLHLVFGDELNEGFWQSAEALDITDDGLRQLKDRGRDSPLLKSLGIGCAAGRRTVRINWRDQGLGIPCHVLPGRVTLFVITREMDGAIEIHQYMPISGVPDANLHDYPTWNNRDPFHKDSAFAAIRRIEYMQRTFAQGRVSPLKPDIELLLYDKWVDPIAGCLGSYLALRMGMTEGLDVATANLVRYFGDLPDAHVLRAAYLLGAGKPKEAQVEFQQSIDIGMPIFREGMILLADKVRSLPFKAGVKKRLAELSLRLAGGQLWSMELMETDSHDPTETPWNAAAKPLKKKKAMKLRRK